MERVLDYLKTVTDERQEKKVRHNIGDIVALVFFATLAFADEWAAIEVFGNEHEDFLRRYAYVGGVRHPESVKLDTGGGRIGHP